MEGENGHSYDFGRFRLNVPERRLSDSETQISLTPKAFDVLSLLVQRAGHLVGKEELMSKVWPDSFVEEANVARIVHTLRKKLGDDGNGVRFIETVPTKGYRLVVAVKESSETSSLIKSDRSVSVETVPVWPALVNSDLVDHPNSEPVTIGELDAEPVIQTIVKRGSILIVAISVCVLALVSIFTFSQLGGQRTIENGNLAAERPTLYWEMSDVQKGTYIQSRIAHVQNLIGDDFAELNDESVNAVRSAIENYVQRKDSLSQEAFKDGLRSIYGRASQYAPFISREYEKKNVPPVLGIYQAMIESEYRDCFVNELGNVGMFQFTHRTAHKYGLSEHDLCSVDKQSEAAAQYMSDLLSDFGAARSSWTLALLSYNNGEEQSRDQLRELRTKGITERTFWTVFENRDRLETPLSETSQSYVPRFFAAAIIGESPENFSLATPPLSELR